MKGLSWVTEMIRLDLAESGKTHIKDEVQHIRSMCRSEMLAIEYADEATAYRKAGMQDLERIVHELVEGM